MPVHVEKRGSGQRPWKLVDPNGKVVASSTTKKKAEISASYRNAAVKRKTGK